MAVMTWIGHPSFRKHEQLMAVLQELGMATYDQLQTVTGWSGRAFKRHLQTLHDKNRVEEEPQWLVMQRLPTPVPIEGHRTDRKASSQQSSDDEYSDEKPLLESRYVYSLGKKGTDFVHKMQQRPGKASEPPTAQAYHYIGTNAILVRFLKTKGVDRKEVVWHSSYETAERLAGALEMVSGAEKIDMRSLIRPDAHLKYKSVSCYIEYDNNTEGSRQLETKFHAYVETLLSIGNKEPVIWVAVSPARALYLERIWARIQKRFYSLPGQDPPAMHFFAAGEETTWLLTLLSPPSLRRGLQTGLAGGL